MSNDPYNDLMSKLEHAKALLSADNHSASLDTLNTLDKEILIDINPAMEHYDVYTLDRLNEELDNTIHEVLMIGEEGIKDKIKSALVSISDFIARNRFLADIAIGTSITWKLDANARAAAKSVGKKVTWRTGLARSTAIGMGISILIGRFENNALTKGGYSYKDTETLVAGIEEATAKLSKLANVSIPTSETSKDAIYKSFIEAVTIPKLGLTCKIKLDGKKEMPSVITNRDIIKKPPVKPHVSGVTIQKLGYTPANVKPLYIRMKSAHDKLNAIAKGIQSKQRAMLAIIEKQPDNPDEATKNKIAFAISHYTVIQVIGANAFNSLADVKRRLDMVVRRATEKGNSEYNGMAKDDDTEGEGA